MTWRDMWRGWVRADERSYVRKLEAEIARLRAENRALLNSILGIAGVPPVVVAEEANDPEGARAAQDRNAKPNGSAVAMGYRQPASAGEAGQMARSQTDQAERAGRRVSRSNTGIDAGKMLAVPAKRKRSWQQVSRTLEIGAATKKKPQGNES